MQPNNDTFKVTKRSRVTAACAICRTKRQRCSGERPTCVQCSDNHEVCRWNDQKKRGPMKDLLKSLQDRLQETENCFLALLAQSSDEDVSRALCSPKPVSLQGVGHQEWTTSCAGPEYWSRFPLNEVAGIRAWQSDRNQRHASLNPGEGAGQSLSSSIQLLVSSYAEAQPMAYHNQGFTAGHSLAQDRQAPDLSTQSPDVVIRASPDTLTNTTGSGSNQATNPSPYPSQLAQELSTHFKFPIQSPAAASSKTKSSKDLFW